MHPTRHRNPLLAAGIAAALTLTACGGDETVGTEPDTTSIVDDTTEPDDNIEHDDTTSDSIPDDLITDDDTDNDANADTGEPNVTDPAQHRNLLGTPQDDLDDNVRIGRAGDEHMALTMDHVVGRVTVEVDPDDDGTYRVTVVHVETENGLETFHADDTHETTTTND